MAEILLYSVFYGLAVWRISSLLVDEAGPFDFLGRMRYAFGVRYDEKNVPTSDNQIGAVFLCVWCMSIWVSLFVWCMHLISPEITRALLFPFAVSGFSIIVGSIAVR